MRLEEFVAGTYKDNFKNKKFAYKSFSPNPINKEWTWDDADINVLLGEACRALGELNAYTDLIPDIELFIRMHVFKEADTSSRIEGTKTNIEENLMDIEHIPPEKRNDWQEVNNYVKAMERSLKQLQELPLSIRLLRDTHYTLMQGVRGKHKTPGELRHTQNWIGGRSIIEATFIPPHFEEINDSLTDLEKFIHNDQIKVPHLIKCAIIHYQFETIHPFLDGNGRIGRLLITLYLVSKGLLNYPSLYLSDYLEQHRLDYYDNLMRVRKDNNLIQWIHFFLKAIISTAQKGVKIFRLIINLKKEVDSKIVTFGKRAENARKLVEHMYSDPIVSVLKVANYLEKSFNYANTLVNELVEHDILREITGNSRNRIFVFYKYLNAFKK